MATTPTLPTPSYSDIREANIARNEAYLRSIGLLDVGAALGPTRPSVGVRKAGAAASSIGGRAAASKAGTKRARDTEADAAPGSPRRSSRIPGLTASRRAAAAAAADDDDDYEEDEEDEDGGGGGGSTGRGGRGGSSKRRRRAEPSFSLHVDVDAADTARRAVSAAVLRRHTAQAPVLVSDEQIRHCLMRIRSMSNAALANRVKAIARAAGSKVGLSFSNPYPNPNSDSFSSPSPKP